MNDIEKILQSYGKEEVEIPKKIHYRVLNTLKNKEKKKEYPIMKRLVTMIACMIGIFVGSIGVYAACGGTIAGKPVIEWLGIKFSEEYENYKVNVEGQELYNNDTSVKLISTVCDEGFTILEFDIKLGKANEEKLIDSVYISFNNELINDETGTHLDTLNNYSIIIDREEFWIRPRSGQTINKISDNEYKIYQLYFLTDKELGDKKEFTITLNNVVLNVNYIDEEEGYIPVSGQFNVKVSKEKINQNTKIIETKGEEIKYKNMTKKVEKVIDTPLQTIVKVSSIYENVSLQSLSNNERSDYIDLIEYNAYDDEGKMLGVCSYETKRTIIYEDGRIEEWEQGDIGTSEKFKNARMELTEYIIIEKNKENSIIKIRGKELSNNKVFGGFEINLNTGYVKNLQQDIREENETNNQNIKEDEFKIKKVENKDFNEIYTIEDQYEMINKYYFNIKEQNDDLVINIIESEQNKNLLESMKSVEYNKKYIISNVKAKDVEKVFYGNIGQDMVYPLVFLLQKDGTIKGIDIEYGYKTGQFIARNVEGLKDVAKIEQASVSPANDSGYETIIAITKDEVVYEIYH